MSVKLKDKCIEADQKYGPMPNFNGTFERFFIEKSANLIFANNNELKEDQYIVIKLMEKF